jgi:hypothetical protein
LPTPAIITRPLVPSGQTPAIDKTLTPITPAKAIERETAVPERLPPPTTAAAPSPPAPAKRAPGPPDPEITGSILANAETEPNVQPDWKKNQLPRRSAVNRAAQSRDDVNPILEFFYRNSVVK